MTREERLAYSRAYYQKNREKLVAYRRDYLEKNRDACRVTNAKSAKKYPDRVKARQAAYYEKNKEKLIAAASAYYEVNKEKVLATNREYVKKNPEKIRNRNVANWAKNKKTLSEANKKWRLENVEHLKERYKLTFEAKKPKRRAWREKNLDREREKSREWYKSNRDKARIISSRRRTLMENACPSWVDFKEIAKVYEEAVRLQNETGIPYHVDHMVPLKHKLVCGLHVPANLRAITAEENQRKKNTFIEALAWQLPPQQT